MNNEIINKVLSKEMLEKLENPTKVIIGCVVAYKVTDLIKYLADKGYNFKFQFGENRIIEFNK